MTVRTDAPAGRNPGPRPALRFEGEEHFVLAARPLPGHDPHHDVSSDHGKERDKSERAARKNKADKAKKDGKGRRRKAVKKRPKDLESARRSDDKTLAIVLPQEFRKALERAAGEHGLTPEGLAAFILVEWLDR